MSDEAERDADRFRSKHAVDMASGCWTWTASTGGGGYGQFRVGKRMLKAHRFSYELHVGPIPDGLQLDHLCRNRLCVNPAHLEPVTPRENTMRSLSPSAINAAKTHCHNGHELPKANTELGRARRICKSCRRDKRRALAIQLGLLTPNSVKTHCNRGHEFTPENTRLARGRRVCRSCDIVWSRMWKARARDIASRGSISLSVVAVGVG